MAKWIALALVGLLVAVGVAYAASRLASPKVALSSEPVSAGAKLAPPAARKPAPRRVRKHRRSRGNGTTSPAPPPAPTTTTTVPVPAPAPARPPPTTTRPAAPSPSRDDSGGGRDD